MTYLLFRSIYQQLAKVHKMEPNVADYFKEIMKIHLKAYYRNRQKIESKLKKQNNTQLLEAFLKFLTLVNSKGTYNAYRAKIKTIQIFTGINMYVDRNCNLRSSNLSVQMKQLQAFSQYKNLIKSQQQFVQSVIKKVFLGEQTYFYSNLTSFFSDNIVKEKGRTKESLQYLKVLDPKIKQYTDKALRGEINGVSQQFVKIYQKIFDQERLKELSITQQVYNSYLESNYIPINFDDINLR